MNLESTKSIENVIFIEKKKRNAELMKKFITKSTVSFSVATILVLSSPLKMYGFEPIQNSQTQSVENVAVEIKPQLIQVEEDVKVETEVNKVEEAVKIEQKSVEIYNSNIPMPKEHQEYLYELCQERDLDYKKMLAVIKHESMFNGTHISETNDYGYFQINTINHEDLANKLNTSNNPLDPYVNINWGTYMMSNIYSYWEEQGYTGNELDEIVWSEYNKGHTGVIQSGLAYNYISKVSTALEEVKSIIK